jgi:hypothetical protein
MLVLYGVAVEVCRPRVFRHCRCRESESLVLPSCCEFDRFQLDRIPDAICNVSLILYGEKRNDGQPFLRSANLKYVL